MAPPFSVAEFDILYGQGYLQVGRGAWTSGPLRSGFVEKGGAWFYLRRQAVIGQGRENAKKFLEDNPDVLEDIEKKVREKRDQLGDKLEEDLDDDDLDGDDDGEFDEE